MGSRFYDEMRKRNPSLLSVVLIVALCTFDLQIHNPQIGCKFISDPALDGGQTNIIFMVALGVKKE